MAGLSSIPNIPGAGRRQRRAAALKAEMEAKAKQKAEEGAAAAEEAKNRKKEAEGMGPLGEGEYEVGQGECISSIAKKTGHYWEKIWNDPANAALKEVRKDPNVLLPKDRVKIPEKEQKYESGETEMRHRFVRRGEPSMLRLQFHGQDGPRANEPYELVVDERVYRGTTDSEGKSEERIPGNAKQTRMYLGRDREEYEIDLGQVDPITELKGVQERLNNLGFHCGTPDGAPGPMTRRALLDFQRKHGAEETGEPDEPTRNELRRVHGC